MRNRYELLSSDSEFFTTPLGFEEDSSSGDSGRGRRCHKKNLTCNLVKGANRNVSEKKDCMSIDNKHGVQLGYHDHSERLLLDNLRSCNWRRDDGQPIDKEVLKKYRKQVKESEGFDITDFPGYIEGVTVVVPLQSIIEQRERCREQYDRIMDLASLAIKAYNKKHRQTKFKVVEIEKLNCNCCGSHFITFNAVDVKGIEKGSHRAALFNHVQIIKVTLLLWLLFLFSPYTSPRRELEEKLLKLKCAPYLKASEDEAQDQTAARKTFQAEVSELIDEVEVVLCRAV